MAAEHEAAHDGGGNVQGIELRDLHLRNARRRSADETIGDACLRGASKVQSAAQQRQGQDWFANHRPGSLR